MDQLIIIFQITFSYLNRYHGPSWVLEELCHQFFSDE